MGLLDKIKQQYGSKVIKPVGPGKFDPNNVKKIINGSGMIGRVELPRPNISKLTNHPPGIKKMSKEENQRLIEALKKMHK